MLSCSVAGAQEDPFGDPDPFDNDPFGDPDPIVGPDPFDDPDPFGAGDKKPVLVKPKAKKPRGKPIVFEFRDQPSIAAGEVKTNEPIYVALRQPVNIEMNDNSLEDLASAIRHKFGIPVQIEPISIDAAKVNPEDRNLKFNKKQTPLFEVLSEVLKAKKLNFTVWNGSLWITGAECERNYHRRIYAITDFVKDAQLSGQLSSKAVLNQTSGLKNLITNTVSPKSWLEENAAISPVSLGAGGVVFVVTQTTEGHIRLDAFLANLRADRNKLAE